MRILIVDDNPIHRASAEKTLAGHELVILSDYDSARKMIVGKPEPYPSRNWIVDEKFDAILIDLLMPVGSIGLSEEARLKFLGQEMPVGWALAMLAAIGGTKHVAVVTDLDHHDHPASAMLDGLCSTRFKINGATLLLFRSSMYPVPCTECDGSEYKEGDKTFCQTCHGMGEKFLDGKNWGKVLKNLLDDTGW